MDVRKEKTQPGINQFMPSGWPKISKIPATQNESVVNWQSMTRDASHHHGCLGLLSAGYNSYSTAYYAYLLAEMLDDDAYQWFEENGGLTRGNGDKFRRMVLSRGNTEDLAKMYVAWRGREPTVEAMLKYRGLQDFVH